ncbi:phosphonate C-P lyase system protein PhnH [Sabulicella glaciei]|uniref:Phosphonate C-P lyase system protein PhnH n=1 Tax=Sabulicella glaciei TaxID=2984948 RepID=A0ABT3NS04_9PROT|nr:phosphonate C-P lyase system protein PhnH [Roseococcus sp. MDT2-1-1]MCW8084940.1 phosphonate C-P lyase system protein PhnH [Roseococcus sp. MDT2-1-1]
MKPGFHDPVLDAQACFRAAMEAMARPGRVQEIVPPEGIPNALDPAAAALLLTLVDADTPFWTDAGEETRGWIAFHCGAPLVPPGDAAFAVVTGALPPLSLFREGTDEAPQDGTTVILQLRHLVPGEGWRLLGPGIETEHRLRVDGLPEGFATSWDARRAAFPRGVDLFLCAGTRFAALPRTVRIEEHG